PATDYRRPRAAGRTRHLAPAGYSRFWTSTLRSSRAKAPSRMKEPSEVSSTETTRIGTWQPNCRGVLAKASVTKEPGFIHWLRTRLTPMPDKLRTITGSERSSGLTSNWPVVAELHGKRTFFQRLPLGKTVGGTSADGTGVDMDVSDSKRTRG